MARGKRNRNRSSRRKSPAGAAPLPQASRRPSPRPHFHYERRPGHLGDYEIQLTLADVDDGGQAVIARVRPPGGEPFELTRRVLGPKTPRLTSDATRTFGAPPGLPPAVLREILLECRAWTQRDNALNRRGRTVEFPSAPLRKRGD